MMVFSLGQSEQYGYYKRVTNWSTIFDSDLAEEIANPERMAIGTLDLNFVLIYLTPILIIILLFNIGGLERAVGGIKNFFFKEGVQMVVDGLSLEEVTEILETRIEYREKREKVQTDMLKAMGDLSPAWGMVGTLIGLVLMLAGFGGEGGADNLGGGMAAALITTLYGAVFANLFFLPMAQKMGNKTTQTSMSSNLLVEAARLIHMKKHPLIVREKLNSFIPPAEWKRE